MKLPIPPPPPEPPRTTASKIRNFASGLLLFGPADFIAVALAANGSPASGVTLLPAAILGATVVLVAVAFLYIGRRMLAAGWVSGYLLMSLFSVGACTLIVDPRSSTGGAISGLLLYLLLFAVAGVTAVASFAVRR